MANLFVLLASLSFLLGACAPDQGSIGEPTSLLPDVTPNPELPLDTPPADATEVTVRVPSSTSSSTPTISPTAMTTDLPSVSPSLTSPVESMKTVSSQTQTGCVRLYRSFANPAKSRLDLDTGQVTGPENLEADIEF
jgi:hypothetical protein